MATRKTIWKVTTADGKKIGKALTEATAHRMARAYEQHNGKGATVVAPEGRK